MGVFEQVPYTNFHDLNLDWILERMKEIKVFLDNLPPNLVEDLAKIDDLETSYSFLKKRVDALEQFETDFLNGKYIGKEIEALSSWIDDNLISMVSKIVKFVFFYLDDSGHFCADIPDSWDFLHFDTVVDSNSENYGCLTFSWL